MRGFPYLDEDNESTTVFSRVWARVRRRNPDNLPITENQAIDVTKYMAQHYGARIEAATAGTPFPAPLLSAIACQETAYRWVHRRNDFSPAEILALCVFDASGDVLGTRRPFPRNTPEFRARFGDTLTEMLIAEGNAMRRRLMNWSPRPWVYCGYGIFQYDLQAIDEDPAYFKERQWYDFDICLGRVMRELKAKFAETGELWEAVRAYNGGGAAALRYKRNVQHFFAICERHWSVATTPVALMTLSAPATLWDSPGGPGVVRNLPHDPRIRLRVTAELLPWSQVQLLTSGGSVAATGWIETRVLVPISSA